MNFETPLNLAHAHFLALLACDNPSGKEEEIRAYVTSCLKKWHLLEQKEHLFIQDEIGNLYFRLVGNNQKEPLLFCAHMDSVPPCIDISYKTTQQADGSHLIQADGKTVLGADDRSGVAVMLSIIEHCITKCQDHPTLEFLFTAQEEVGIKGARVFDVTQLLSRDVYVLDGEGPVGAVFNQGPARSTLKLEIIGQPSHAGISPEKGLNAISILGQLLLRLPSSGRVSKENTWNIGKVKGGKALNVVADDCTLEAEFRSTTNEGLLEIEKQVNQAIDEVLALHPNLVIHRHWQLQYPAFTVDKNQVVVEKSIQSAKKCGLSPTIKPMAIGSDAHILNQKELNAVVWGMGFTGSHSVEEKILVEDLNKVFEWAKALIEG